MGLVFVHLVTIIKILISTVFYFLNMYTNKSFFSPGFNNN